MDLSITLTSGNFVSKKQSLGFPAGFAFIP